MPLVGPLLSAIEPWRPYQASGDDGCAEDYGGTRERQAPFGRPRRSRREDYHPTQPEIQRKNGLLFLSVLCLCRVVGFSMGLIRGAFIGGVLLMLWLVGYPREKLMVVVERMENEGLDEDQK